VKPRTYPPSVHHIDKEQVDKQALLVIEKLQEHGYESYLVGGGVRDLLAGVRPKDFDVSTSAKPEEVKAVFGRKCLLIGRRFRLAHIRFGRNIIEVATFRSCESEGEGELIVSDNVFGTPEEDALRRDFTINGLFYNPHDEMVIDFVGGFEDLKEKRLSAIGDPLIRFREDPVRMIRLLKFQSRFDYIPDEASMEAVNVLKEEITKSSQARILEELLRMLESGFSAPFFALLNEKGLLVEITPLLSKFLDGEQSEVIYKYLEAADKLHSRFGVGSIERPVLTSCLLYPVLEERVKKIAEETEKPPHLGQIMFLAHQLIKEMMTTSFSKFPRRLNTLMSLLLINQYRLTPLGKRAYSHTRFLHSKEFPMALKFLKLRALVNEDLKEPYSSWKEKYRNEVHHGDRTPHPHTYHHPRSKRRRTRSR